jgi:hypothetical protein
VNSACRGAPITKELESVVCDEIFVEDVSAVPHVSAVSASFLERQEACR